VMMATLPSSFPMSSPARSPQAISGRPRCHAWLETILGSVKFRYGVTLIAFRYQ